LKYFVVEQTTACAGDALWIQLGSYQFLLVDLLVVQGEADSCCKKNRGQLVILDTKEKKTLVDTFLAGWVFFSLFKQLKSHQN